MFEVNLLNPSSGAHINSLLFRSAKQWLFVLTLLETVRAQCICVTHFISYLAIGLQASISGSGVSFVLTKGGFIVKGLKLLSRQFFTLNHSSYSADYSIIRKIHAFFFSCSRFDCHENSIRKLIFPYKVGMTGCNILKTFVTWIVLLPRDKSS